MIITISLFGIAIREREVRGFPLVFGEVVETDIVRLVRGTYVVWGVRAECAYEFDGKHLRADVHSPQVSFPSKTAAEEFLKSGTFDGRCALKVDPANPSDAYFASAKTSTVLTVAFLVAAVGQGFALLVICLGAKQGALSLVTALVKGADIAFSAGN
jgi:hypothetical protein